MICVNAKNEIECIYCTNLLGLSHEEWSQLEVDLCLHCRY